jgi:hypothetical protein
MFSDNPQAIAPRYPLQAMHPLAGSIDFIVDRSIRDGTAIAIKPVAERLMSASLDRRLTVANLEAEISRVALGRGARIEPAPRLA